MWRELFANAAATAACCCLSHIAATATAPACRHQLLLHLLDRHLHPQAALDVPRFCIGGVDSAAGPSSVLSSSLLLEEGLPQQLVDALAARGDDVRIVSGPARSVFGKGTIIAREPDSGVLCGGADPRSDGCVMAW